MPPVSIACLCYTLLIKTQGTRQQLRRVRLIWLPDTLYGRHFSLTDSEILLSLFYRVLCCLISARVAILLTQQRNATRLVWQQNVKWFLCSMKWARSGHKRNLTASLLPLTASYLPASLLPLSAPPHPTEISINAIQSCRAAANPIRAKIQIKYVKYVFYNTMSRLAHTL